MPFIVPLNGSPFTIAGIDAGNEPWTFSGYGTVLSAANWAAKQALFTTLVDAVVAVILGDIKYVEYGNRVTQAYAQPTNGATREIALKFQVKDGTTQAKDVLSLPTIDPTIPSYIANANARDAIEVTSPTAISDLVSALQAFAVNPVTGNAWGVYGLKVARGLK